MKIQTKVKRFVKFLRNILDSDCCEHQDSRHLSDSDVLEIFRTCMDCGEEAISLQQQMHAIIEWDEPERAFETLCELMFDSEEESCIEAKENFDFDLNI